MEGLFSGPLVGPDHAIIYSSTIMNYYYKNWFIKWFMTWFIWR